MGFKSKFSVENSHDLSSLMEKYLDYEYEVLFILSMDKENKIINTHMFEGGPTTLDVDHELIFSLIENDGATKFIMLHNHPSGTLKPSQQDNYLTYEYANKMKKKGVQLLDHLVFTKEGYFSYYNTETLNKYLREKNDYSVEIELADTYYTRMVPDYPITKRR